MNFKKDHKIVTFNFNTVITIFSVYTWKYCSRCNRGVSSNRASEDGAITEGNIPDADRKNSYCIYSLLKKCPYSELFWSAFSRIQIEYGEILRISPYSLQMWENADQNNAEYGHFLRTVDMLKIYQRGTNLFEFSQDTNRHFAVVRCNSLFEMGSSQWRRFNGFALLVLLLPFAFVYK